jgi:hypothetical protein
MPAAPTIMPLATSKPAATMRALVTFAVFALVMAPAAVGAQLTTTPEAAPADPPPQKLFQDEPPRSPGGWTGSLKGINLWKPPASGSEIPRWTIGWTATLTAPGGAAFSAGFLARQGDPMPLFLSQPDLPEVFGSSIIGPGTYRLQLDLTFGLSAPIWAGDRRKVNALGDVIIPLPSVGSGDPAAPLLNSRSVRVGIGAGF